MFESDLSNEFVFPSKADTRGRLPELLYNIYVIHNFWSFCPQPPVIPALWDHWSFVEKTILID